MTFGDSQEKLSGFRSLCARFPALSSFLLCAALLCLQLAFFRPYFELNDDTFKVFFSKGVGTDLQPSEFIGYSNVILGFFLKALFSLFPGIPWYGLFLVAVQFLGVWFFLWSLLLRPWGLFKTLFFLVASFAVYSHFFTTLQFTATSSLATQGGLFLFLSLMGRKVEKPRPFGLVLALCLLFTASVIRFDSFWLTLLCAVPFLTFFSWENRSALGTTSVKTALGLGALAILGGAYFNHYWCQKDPAWKAFNLFDRQRVECQDYRIVEYTPQTKPFFDEAGWSANDLKMFKDWYFLDEDKYDWRNLQRLNRHFPRIGTKGKTATYLSLPEIFFSPLGGGILLFFLAFLLFVPKESLRLIFLNFLWVLLVLLVLLYFWRAPGRVVHPLLTFLMNSAIFHMVKPSRLRGVENRDLFNLLPKMGLVFLLCFCVLAAKDLRKEFRANSASIKAEEDLKTQLDTLHPGEGQLFVTWDSSFPYELFNAFDNFETFRKFHVFSLAVYQRSPNAKKMLDHFGIKDLFSDLVDNPNLLLICSPQELEYYHQYMLERHQNFVYLEKIFGCPLFKAYRVLSKKTVVRKLKSLKN